MRNKGAGFVFSDGRKILLVKRNDEKGQWDVPGGRSKEDEFFLQTAQRETKEEIGHMPSGQSFCHLDQKAGNNFFRIYIQFVPKEFSCSLSEEHENYKWADIDKVEEENLCPKIKNKMKEITKKIRDEKEPHHLGFYEFYQYKEMMGSTADLWAGYHKGVDYQIQGDPSSMFPQKREKKKKKKKKTKK